MKEGVAIWVRRSGGLRMGLEMIVAHVNCCYVIIFFAIPRPNCETAGDFGHETTTRLLAGRFKPLATAAHEIQFCALGILQSLELRGLNPHNDLKPLVMSHKSYLYSSTSLPPFLTSPRHLTEKGGFDYKPRHEGRNSIGIAKQAATTKTHPRSP
jgi:hypothetical protein